MADNAASVKTPEDFESFLQKCLDCKNLKLIDLKTSQLVPLGENYGSIILKVNAEIRRRNDDDDDDEKTETLNLVAKTPNITNERFIYWPEIFQKEVFIYTDLIPTYQELEKDMKIHPVLDITPKYIGHRGSLDDKADVIDEHSMLVMENLNSRGFYILDKRVGMNLEHAKKTLTSLARYHALGIASRRKRPDFFKNVIPQTQKECIDFVQFDGILDDILKIFQENTQLQRHLPLIESCFANIKNGNVYKCHAKEPWITITHGDFWCNNILFHKDEQGRIDDVKFVDFQGYTHNSPQKDLGNLITNNLDKNTKANHLDELLNYYYETFILSLNRLGCDSKPFDKESFYCVLKKQVIHDFPLYTLIAKFLVFEVKEEHNRKIILHEVFNSQSSDAHIQKLKELVELYEKKGWF